MKDYIVITNPTSPTSTYIAAMLFKGGWLVGSIENLTELSDQIERYGSPKLLIYNYNNKSPDDLQIINKLQAMRKTRILAVIEFTDGPIGDEKLWLDADDVVLWPTTEVELALRVRRLLQVKENFRKSPVEPHLVNSSVHSATRYLGSQADYSNNHEWPANLSRQERKVFGALLKAQGKVVPVTQLVDLLGVAKADLPVNSVRVLISRLRKKLNTAPNSTYQIKTNRGMGYRLISSRELPVQPSPDTCFTDDDFSSTQA